MLQRATFANVDNQRGAPDLRRIEGQFGELLDQVEGQIVDGVVTQIFQALENGAFAGAALARNDYQFGLLIRGTTGDFFRIRWSSFVF